MQNFLDSLNPEQRLAAATTEGPLLILAGAGTGKTRAITFRMANLILRGVPAESILALTFTNKAAEEMQNRVSDLLMRAGVPPERPWLSTFHSLCARLLRREAASAGLPSNFSIFDDSDQLAAVKLAMATLNIEDDDLQPRAVLSRISFAKNHAQSPTDIRKEAFTPDARQRNTKKSSRKAKQSISTTCSSALRDCSAIPPPSEKNGSAASNTFTATNIKTPTACSTICCAC